MIKESYSDKYFIHNPYYRQENITEDDLEGDSHRNLLGGKENWDLQGSSQLKLLINSGLTPDMKLLEIGCGYLRAGKFIIDYLSPYNYYGVEVNKKILTIGIENELKKYNLKHKVTDENFILTDRFDLSGFNVQFDMGLAKFVFCYLPLNHLIYFLNVASKHFKKGGKLIISFNLVENDFDLIETYYNDRANNPISKTCEYINYPYYIKKIDLEMICNRPDIPWSFEKINNPYRYAVQSDVVFYRL